MSESMLEKAREVGRLLGQTEEYKALRRAQDRLNDDRESVERLNRLVELEQQITQDLRAGKTPAQEVQQEYEEKASDLQASPIYQGVVAAQSNFDKLMQKVNDEIGKGMQAGAQSSIILP
ncbi:MAG: YlbF family regulator [Gemmatimonadota bacterium]|jgi:cell fate (sporulation/competence/biofilm development) regulator YlbF (YheA/YmcA/DUF963 family)